MPYSERRKIMNYREKQGDTKELKQKYLDGLTSLLESRQDELLRERDEYIKDIFADPEKYRKDLAKMLGWPLTEPRERKIPRATKTELSREEALGYLRKQEVAVDRFTEGMNLVLFEGLPLGFAKRIGGRVNNLYPNVLRILKYD